MALAEDGIKKILAQTKIKENPNDYSIVFVDPSQRDKALNAVKSLPPFISYTLTTDEVSLVMCTNDWIQMKKSFPGHKEEGPYRLITFDIILDLSIVGFLSVVSSALADSGVSVYAISTFLKDHILVKKEDVGKAVAVLNGLINKT